MDGKLVNYSLEELVDTLNSIYYRWDFLEKRDYELAMNICSEISRRAEVKRGLSMCIGARFSLPEEEVAILRRAYLSEAVMADIISNIYTIKGEYEEDWYSVEGASGREYIIEKRMVRNLLTDILIVPENKLEDMAGLSEEDILVIREALNGG